MIKQGQSTLANEVTNVISRATSDVGIEAKCYTDFLRDRVKEDLIQLRATLTHETLELKTIFCNLTPISLDMSLPLERRPVIEITGYNLNKNTIKVFLLDNQDQKTDVTSALSQPTEYLLTLNVGSNGVALLPNTQKILFELPNGIKDIAVIQPPPPPPKVEFLSRRIHVTGRIDMNDDENFVDDENKSVSIDTYIDVPSEQNIPYHWEDCVGGEVQGYLDVQLQLDRNTGMVSGQGIGKYFEGTSCGATNEHGSRALDFRLNPGQEYVYQADLSDGDGHIIYNLNFKN